MKALYQEKTANYPRLETDKFFVDYENTYQYQGAVDKAIRFVEEFQLLDASLWTRFVDQFRMEDADAKDGGWRGEYWGKMMRGACLTYSYTKNEHLYETLRATVEDLLSCQEADGRIGSYKRGQEFRGWDVWCRKYVLLGMEYFLEICKDSALEKKIIESLCKQTDYMMQFIGAEEEGKTEITETTNFWRGLNSSSLLEPIVRLYSLTKEQKYFDFASYIVACGGTDVENIFDLAYEDKLYPYQYPMTKAYEMISCFEGLLEFYRVTGEEKYKTAVVNFANKVLESDFTIIGSCGCSHELFDRSTVRQANTNNGELAQETCVTVTIMKFMYQLHLLTGNAKYADAFETSLYNAYFGAINTEKIISKAALEELPNSVAEPLPFDSYSPLVASRRGKGVGGLKLMADNHYYGCCACIGSAGNGLIPKMALLTTEDGFAMNLFIPGTAASVTPKGQSVEFTTQTAYPKSGEVEITVHLTENERFTLLVRNPAFSKTTKLSVNGEPVSVTEGYISVDREWKNGDVVTLSLDMRTRAIYPISYGHNILMIKPFMKRDFYILPVYDEEDPMAKNHVAICRGPIVMAQENRLGYSVDEPVSIVADQDGYVDAKFPEKDIAPYEHMVELQVPLADGTYMTLTDYASAGKTYTDESKMAAWILTKAE